MEEKKTKKIDLVVVMAILILIAFIGVMSFAMVQGIMQYTKKDSVAYADDTLYADIEFQYGLSRAYNWNLPITTQTVTPSAPLVSLNLNHTSCYLSAQNTGTLVKGTLSVDGDGLKLLSDTTTSTGGALVYFIYRLDAVASANTDYYVYIDGGIIGSYKAIGFCNFDASTNTISDATMTNYGRYGVVITPTTDCLYFFLRVSRRVSITFNKIKIEQGHMFSGWSPLDTTPFYQNGYTNGYNEGYFNGVDDTLDLGNPYFSNKGYTFLDYLSFSGSGANLTSEFVLGDHNYWYGDFTEDTQSLYNYNNPSFAVLDSLDSAPNNNYQIGYKYSSNLLYGDILMLIPYAEYDTRLMVVFEIIDTGEILYTDRTDSLHWSLVNHLGNINNNVNWSVDYYQVHFYSSSLVNIYFVPRDPLNYPSEALLLPLATNSWQIYSTLGGSPLTTFDEGYEQGHAKGYQDAEQANAQAVVNARASGYEQGRREALEDTSDYTFMGLIGSVIDAPITSFKGLLNFSILGVNMQSFVLAILTLCVIIIVIKIALGGK